MMRCFSIYSFAHSLVYLFMFPKRPLIFIEGRENPHRSGGQGRMGGVVASRGAWKTSRTPKEVGRVGHFLRREEHEQTYGKTVQWTGNKGHYSGRPS